MYADVTAAAHGRHHSAFAVGFASAYSARRTLAVERAVAAMGRQCHVEIRPNLNESAFGLITDIWERVFQEVL